MYLIHFYITILIVHRTAAPYFSNLVWFIGKHILELDACVRTDIEYVVDNYFLLVLN